LAVFETIRHQVTIAGRVKDRVTGKPVEDALIEIVGGPPAYLAMIDTQTSIYGAAWATMAKRPDRTVTRPDGHFHFMDFPDGTYTLTASCKRLGKRYGTAGRDVTVSRTPQGNVNLVSSDILLPPSTVKGRILRQGASTPVIMAEIRVSGSLEYSYSDENGEYILAGIEASAARPRSVTVSAVGFQDRTLDVLLPAAGDEVVLNIQIAPL
jgi:hypothetical protein